MKNLRPWGILVTFAYFLTRRLNMTTHISYSIRCYSYKVLWHGSHKESKRKLFRSHPSMALKSFSNYCKHFRSQEKHEGSLEVTIFPFILHQILSKLLFFWNKRTKTKPLNQHMTTPITLYACLLHMLYDPLWCP